MGIYTPRVIRAFLLAAAAFFSGCAIQRHKAAKMVHFAGYKLTGHAPARECWSESDYRACVYRPKKNADPGTLVYFMHYATGSERSFEEIGLGRAFYAEYEKRGVAAPAVVSVSFGTHWLLTGSPGGRQVVPLDRFVGEVMPAVEKRLGGSPARRMVWGMSMGGYNAAELAFQRPAEFSAAVLSCPALHAVDPMEAEKEAPALARRAGVPKRWADDGMALFYHRLGGPKVWQEENPLAALARGAATPPLLIQANRSDEYAFFEGAETLASALKAAGRRVEFSPINGGHCLVDAREAARFLSAR